VISIWNKEIKELYLPLGEEGFPDGYDRLLSSIDFTDGEYPNHCVICREEISLKSSHPIGNSPNPIKLTGRCCDECDRQKVLPRRIDYVRGKRCSTRRIPYSSPSRDEFVGWGRGGTELRRDSMSNETYWNYKKRMKDKLIKLNKEIDVNGLLEWSSKIFQCVEDYLLEGRTQNGDRGRLSTCEFPHTIVNNRYFLVRRSSFYGVENRVMVKEIDSRL